LLFTMILLNNLQFSDTTERTIPLTTLKQSDAINLLYSLPVRYDRSLRIWFHFDEAVFCAELDARGIC